MKHHREIRAEYLIFVSALQACQDRVLIGSAHEMLHPSLCAVDIYLLQTDGVDHTGPHFIALDHVIDYASRSLPHGNLQEYHAQRIYVVNFGERGTCHILYLWMAVEVLLVVIVAQEESRARLRPRVFNVD